MHCNNLRLVLGLGLVKVSSRVRVRIRVKVRVSVMVRVSIRTSWVANFALFGCYRPVNFTRPHTRIFTTLFVIVLYLTCIPRNVMPIMKISTKCMCFFNL